MLDMTNSLRQFRRSLVALIPVMDEAGIGWRDNEQYDSFDGLAAAAFRAFVIDSLEEAPEVLSKLDGYQYDVSPYCSSSGIVFLINERGKMSKFVRLATTNEPFDTVVFEADEGAEGQVPIADCEIVLGTAADFLTSSGH
jgi:hypothetical protein